MSESPFADAPNCRLCFDQGVGDEGQVPCPVCGVAPHGSCMVCGHDKPYGVWHESLVTGVCFDCRDAAQAVAHARISPAATYLASGDKHREWHAWDRSFSVTLEGKETAGIEGLAYAMRYLVSARRERERHG